MVLPSHLIRLIEALRWGLQNVLKVLCRHKDGPKNSSFQITHPIRSNKLSARKATGVIPDWIEQSKKPILAPTVNKTTQPLYNYSGITRPSDSNYMWSRTIIPHNNKTISINSKQIRHFIKRLLNSNNQFSDSSDKQALYDLQQLGSNNKNYNAVKTKQRTRNIHRPNSSTLKNKRRRIFILRRWHSN